MMSSSPPQRLFALCLLGGSLLLACERKSEEATPLEDKTGTKPIATQLPPLELKDDTKDLLLTYVDDKGDFHVVQKPDAVPEKRREHVRAVLTTQELGTGKLVYVADLRKKGPDGSYPVTTWTRAQWDELGAKKREARLEELAPGVKKALGDDTTPAKGPVSATIYGADWCKPCHDAENFLKSLGVKVTKKNIEKDSDAAREMQRKLASINRSGASIPVIDVMGRVMVGFSPVALKRAVERVKPQPDHGETL